MGIVAFVPADCVKCFFQCVVGEKIKAARNLQNTRRPFHDRDILAHIARYSQSAPFPSLIATGGIVWGSVNFRSAMHTHLSRAATRRRPRVATSDGAEEKTNG